MSILLNKIPNLENKVWFFHMTFKIRWSRLFSKSVTKIENRWDSNESASIKLEILQCGGFNSKSREILIWKCGRAVAIVIALINYGVNGCAYIHRYRIFVDQDIQRLRAMDSGNITNWRQQLDSLMYTLRQVSIRYQVILNYWAQKWDISI